MGSNFSHAHRPSIEPLGNIPNDDRDTFAAVTLLVKKLASSGAETEFIEETASAALRSLGIPDVLVSSQPNQVQFISPERSWGVSVESFVSVSMAESAAAPLLEVCRKSRDSTWLLAKANLVEAEERVFPLWIQFFGWIGLSGAAVVVFFKGSWPNVLLAVVASIFSFMFAAVLPLFVPKLSFSAGFLGGFAAGFVIKAAASLGLVQSACVQGVAISSIIALVPGTGITLGTLDIIHGNLVTGAARLIGALVQAFLQGLGLVVGSQIAAWYSFPEIPPDAVCEDAVSGWFMFLLIPMVWTGWCILLDCPLKHWPFYWVSALISCVISYFLKYAPTALPAYAPVLISSITIGIYGAVFQRLSGIPSFGVVLIGIYALLPGGSSVWESVATIMNKGDAYASSILQTSLYIAAGLAFANAFYTKFDCSCCKGRVAQDANQSILREKSKKLFAVILK